MIIILKSICSMIKYVITQFHSYSAWNVDRMNSSSSRRICSVFAHVLCLLCWNLTAYRLLHILIQSEYVAAWWRWRSRLSTVDQHKEMNGELLSDDNQFNAQFEIFSILWIVVCRPTNSNLSPWLYSPLRVDILLKCNLSSFHFEAERLKRINFLPHSHRAVRSFLFYISFSISRTVLLIWQKRKHCSTANKENVQFDEVNIENKITWC